MARRRRRKKKKQKSGKKGLGEPIFLGLAFIFAVIPFFLKDSTGVQYRWAGTYIWLAAYFFAFGGYLFYLLMFVLPIPWNLSWFEGLKLSVAYNFPIIGAFLGVASRRPAAIGECQEDLNSGFLRHRAGIIDSHKVLALSSGSKYSRAAGPGYVHLRSNEIVTQVIDLRRHIRTVPVKAMSGDGIPLETTLTLAFQVRQQDSATEVTAYPYDPEAIFWVNYLESFKSSSGELPWSDRAALDATAVAIEEISRYTLDELLSQSLTDVSTISQARARLKKKLSANLEEYGITLINVAIGSLKMPEEVIVRRIETWQDEIQDRIERSMATENERAELQLIEAEANAQIELVDKLTREIEVTWAEGDVDLAGAVILQLLDQLALVASDREVRALIPAETMTTVEQVETWITNQGSS